MGKHILIRHQNESGFSITEIMIGVGILSVVMGAMLSMATSFSSSMKFAARKEDANANKYSIQSVLMLNEVCACNLQGVTINPTALAAIDLTELNLFNTTGCVKTTNIAKVGMRIPDSSTDLTVTKIQFRNLAAIKPNFYSAALQVDYGAPDGVSVRPSIVPTVMIQTAGASPETVTACGTGLSSSSGSGEYMGLTPTTYTGAMGGITGANTRCQAAFPESHICTDLEIMHSGTTNTPPTGSGGWIFGTSTSTFCASQANCGYFVSNGGVACIFSESGGIAQGNCSNALPIACCK